MKYIGFATNVNKIIIDSTNVTVGEGAVITDNIENSSYKRTRLTSANPSDKYSVTMSFSFLEESKDSSGLTEIERFWRWYKWEHCYGVNPFKFPAILINSNRDQGHSVEDRWYIAHQMGEQFTEADVPDFEYYKITSAVQGQKSGTDLLVNMTWETVATGIITIPDEVSEIDHIETDNGYVDVILTETPSTEPTPLTWDVFINGTQETITNCVFDGDLAARLFFQKKTAAGVYEVSVDNFTGSFLVEDV